MKTINKSTLVSKFKLYMGERSELVELNIRGEKQRKLAELAEFIKWMSINEPTKSFQMPQIDFNKSYGQGKQGLQYVRSNLIKFGVPTPRVTASEDIVHIWSRTPVKLFGEGHK